MESFPCDHSGSWFLPSPPGAQSSADGLGRGIGWKSHVCLNHFIHGPDGRRAARTRSPARCLSLAPASASRVLARPANVPRTCPRSLLLGWDLLESPLHGSDVPSAGDSRGAAGALLFPDRSVSDRGRPRNQEGEDAERGPAPAAAARAERRRDLYKLYNGLYLPYLVSKNLT